VRDLEARRSAVLGLALAGAALLIVSQFATVVSVDVAGGSCEVLNDTDPTLAERCVQTGFERHGPVFPLLAAGVLLMALGTGRSRPAAVAMIVFGAVAMGIVLLSDVPAADETGVIGRDFAGAEAHAGTGLRLEAAGAATVLLAGLVALLPVPASRAGP
jgi:hypothetical protein